MTGERFIALGRWTGILAAVRDDEFDAHLVDLMGNYDDVVETFSNDDLSPQNAPRLTVGAVFCWMVGYNDSASGQRSKVGAIEFHGRPSV